MNHIHKTLTSWLGVYKNDSMVLHANSEADLLRIGELYPEARPIGANHSYNRSALHPVAIKLGPAFDYVEPIDGNNRFRVGGAATIESVMVELMKHGLMLPNSGNHRMQRYISGCIGGTVGFGQQATMHDAIKAKKEIGEVVYEVEIEAVEALGFMVAHCVCPLSELADDTIYQSEFARSYAVMPYSGDDPICVVSEYRELAMMSPQEHNDYEYRGGKHKTWWRIKALQWLQRTIPPIHRLGQRTLNLAKMKTWYSTTSATDIDARYHPWPEADRGPIKSKDTKWLYWSQRPTYQYHNLAFACRPEETESVIQEVIRIAGKNLAGFIGVRELTDKSDYVRALNFDGPRNAIDVYVYPNKKQITEMIERELRAGRFDLRWHPSKSIGIQ